MASGKKPAHPNRNDAQKPLLSACMIVRDEEADLERCLSSVQAVVDEIVIVDTGSRDGTVEIARGLGAKVHHFEWCDDFSAARNAGLEQAAGRWILQLDADEELSPEAARAIRLLVGSAAPKCWGFFVPWRSHVIQSGLRHEKVAYRCLLFRNHRDLRYRSRIHEYIAYVGNGPKPEFSYNDDIVIEHYGYTNDQIQTKGKLERNLRLLELAAAEEPQEAYHHFNLGKHYFGTRRTAEAVAELRRATALCRDPGALYLPNLYATLAMALGRNGEAEQVPLVVAEAERLIPELASDFYFRVGIALKETGKLDQALASLQRAIDERGEATRSDPAISTWRP
ncbi:MAG: glycosyltransferase family 2 protein, partial [Chloroflexi bacterium]|nr:glycosyltransferase family 2 protein [Chloroflexota bacterium]